MSEALRLTREGRLVEAVALLQRTLGAAPHTAATTPRSLLGRRAGGGPRAGGGLAGILADAARAGAGGLLRNLSTTTAGGGRP
ncbi:hypothetical protein, partial [Pseudonocardia sp.]|uniref:hypothetical protein n=1 Tax=Pseudonocardia sp. TaxID=60912 RepID=UPI00262D6266